MKPIDELIRELKSKSSAIRREAALALAEDDDREQAVSALTEALADKMNYVVTAASDTLAQIGGSIAHDALLKLLSHPDPLIREHVLGAFNQVWQSTDFTQILQLFQFDQSSDVRKSAAWLLREKADVQNWRQHFQLWTYDRLPRHRIWACELAGKYGDATIRDQLASFTSDNDGHVRKAASRALVKLGIAD